MVLGGIIFPTEKFPFETAFAMKIQEMMSPASFSFQTRFLFFITKYSETDPRKAARIEPMERRFCSDIISFDLA